MPKKTKWFLIFVLLLSLGLVLVVAGCGTQQSEPKATETTQTTETTEQPGLERVTLKFASMSIGGSWYIYAVNAADIIKPYLPEGSIIDVLPYQGALAIQF